MAMSIYRAGSMSENISLKVAFIFILRDKLIKLPQILFIAFVFLTSKVSYPQETNNIRFQNISIEQGLSNSHVNSIYQDKQGFLWFLTYMGADRYDGYNFDYIIHSEEDTNSLSNSGLFTLFEDSKGIFWFGTFEGLNRYDPSTNKFTHYINIPGDTASISDNNVRSIVETSDGSLWVGTYNGGLNLFDRKTSLFRRFEHDPSDESSIISNKINTLFIDSKDNFWVGMEGGGVSLFDSKTKKFLNIQVQHKYKLLDKTTVVNNFYEDRQGNIWICTWFDGLYELNLLSGEVVNYRNDPNNTNSLNYNTVRDIIQDNQGNYWIATFGGGLNKYEKQKNLFIHYVNDPTNYYSLHNNKLWCLFIDKSGVLWMGSYGNGLSYFNVQKQKFMHFRIEPGRNNWLNSNSTSCFIENGDKLYIGTTDKGLNIYDRKQNSFSYLQFKGKGIVDNIRSMLKDSRGRMWIGTGDGLYRYNPADNTYIYYKNDPSNDKSISVRTVFSIAEDKNGDIWLSLWNNCINRLKKEETFKNDPASVRFIKYLPNINDISGKNFQVANKLFADDEANIWIASTSGFLKLNTKTDSLEFFLRGVFNEIYQDRDKIFWLGTTGKGLFKFNSETKETKNYTIINGLPNNTIFCILEDDHDNLWISTEGGISRMNKKTENFTNYSIKDGLQANEFLLNSGAKLKSGEMVFGGNNGFNMFHPDSLRSTKTIPNIVFTNFKVLNKKIMPGDKINGKIILQKSINCTDEIVLTHKENIFSFEFAALSYNSPEKNHYKYMLEGFDKDWIITDAKSRLATYTNLSGGKYIFKVNGSNSDGIWNNLGRSIKIIILPPFWQTWWFRILTFALIALIIISYYYYRTRSIRMRNIILSRLVAEKTLELQRSNSQLIIQADHLNSVNTLLEERQQQIEEQTEELKTTNENLEELNATKDKFFSIIAHDLKNPFTTLLGFSELLEMNYPKWDESKRKNTIKTIRESSRTVYALLENLLQWSRSQRGMLDYNPESIPLDNLITNAIEVIKTQASLKEITIDYNNESKETSIIGDLKMIDTVIRNLLSNAVKFTKRNGNIIVSVIDKEKEIVISVKDNGIGISPDIIGKIFRIDMHTSMQGTENETGTGLGLILCKEFIDKHKGKIWVESEPGKGSIFSFALTKKSTGMHQPD